MTAMLFILAIWALAALLLAIFASIMYGPRIRGAVDRMRSAVKHRFGGK